MLVQQTLATLKKLRLSSMAEAYQNPPQDSLTLSFDERFGLLVDFEWTARHDRKLARLLKEAKFRLPACMEDIDYQYPRSLDRELMMSLKSLTWIESRQNILISGPTGVGKSYIACAFGNAGCRYGLNVRYLRIPNLFTELNAAKGDGSYPRFRRYLARMKLLILDDWGLSPFTQLEAREVLEIIEDRFQIASTIIVSQLPIESWHQLFVDPTIADAILDRLVHNAHRIEMNGESMRKMLHSTK
jgi:DNA replication protein DnaC